MTSAVDAHWPRARFSADHGRSTGSQESLDQPSRTARSTSLNVFGTAPTIRARRRTCTSARTLPAPLAGGPSEYRRAPQRQVAADRARGAGHRLRPAARCRRTRRRSDAHGGANDDRPGIPSGFVGLSMEFKDFEAYAGHDPKAIDPAFLHLLQNLAPDQPPVLRIGGDSSDWTWWPVPHMSRPAGVRYDLTPTWMRVARAAARDVHARLILGINFEADSTRIAAAEARAMVNRIGRPSIDALELGTEPELYGSYPGTRPRMAPVSTVARGGGPMRSSTATSDALPGHCPPSRWPVRASARRTG